MGSKKLKNAKASSSPIVKMIVKAVMKTIRVESARKYSERQRSVIDTSVIPRVSRNIPFRPEVDVSLKNMGMTKLVEPLPRAAPVQGRMVVQPRFSHAIHMTPRMMPPQQNVSVPQGNYGKIDSLLKDPSVSTIECLGEGRNLTIIRAGQKFSTKISLSDEQIKELLDKIADEAKVPLMDGVFRAALDGFVINAVVSDLIGNRFVIKKQTPYAMLE